MNRSRMMAVLAEYAITHGHSLDAELTRATKALGEPTAEESRAISRAKSGDLGSALNALRLDPLVIEAAYVEPRATLSVSQRLRGLPRVWTLGAPLAVPLLYIMGVSLFQLGIAYFVTSRVDNTFAALFAEHGNSHNLQFIISEFMGAASRILPLVIIIGAPLALLGAGTQLGKRFLSRFAFWSIKPSRVLTMAAELTRHGVSPERSLASGMWLGGWSAEGLERLSHADLTAESLDELATHLAESAASNARDAMTALRIIGTTIILIVGVCIVGNVYLKLPLIPGLVL